MPTNTKALILAVLPKFTSCLSILGSGFNLCDILTDRKKRCTTYARLVAAMAILDICLSSAYFCSTWPIPADSGVLWASGNTATCAAQGFMFQFGLAIPMYNLCLTIYSAMVINLKWSNWKIKNYELGMHATVLSLSLSMALAGFPLTLYNNANLWCWISAHPLNCVDGNSKGGDSGVECVRGKHAWIYRWAFYLWPLWLIIIAVTVCMGMIALGAYRDEKSTRRFRRKSVMSQQDNLSRLTGNVLWQCFYFVLAFYLTWIFPTVLRALQTAGRPVPFAIYALMASLLPMQGFFNAMVFLRPRIVRYRRKYPDEPWVTTICKAIAKTFAKLKPKHTKRPLNLRSRRSNFGLSATTTGSTGRGYTEDNDSHSQLQTDPVMTTEARTAEPSQNPSSSCLDMEPPSSASWRRRRRRIHVDEDEDDGDSSDEEDDQHIVAWRKRVSKALAGDEEDDDAINYESDEEMVDIRKSVAVAMTAAIGEKSPGVMSSMDPSSAHDELLLFELDEQDYQKSPQRGGPSYRVSFMHDVISAPCLDRPSSTEWEDEQEREEPEAIDSANDQVQVSDTEEDCSKNRVERQDQPPQEAGDSPALDASVKNTVQDSSEVEEDYSSRVEQQDQPREASDSPDANNAARDSDVGSQGASNHGNELPGALLGEKCHVAAGERQPDLEQKGLGAGDATLDSVEGINHVLADSIEVGPQPLEHEAENVARASPSRPESPDHSLPGNAQEDGMLQESVRNRGSYDGGGGDDFNDDDDDDDIASDAGEDDENDKDIGEQLARRFPAPVHNPDDPNGT